MELFSAWVCEDIGKDVSAKSENTQKSITVKVDADNSKRALRLSAMDEIIKKGTEQYQFEHFIPVPYYTLHLTVTYPSLFTLFNQLVPYLLAGIPLTVRCNAETAVLVSYISYLLKCSGIPEGVFNQIIDFEATNTRQTASFVLLESADIDSAINNILECPLIYGLTTVRVFVHESLKKNVQQVLKQKFSCQYDNGKLFQEGETFPGFDYVPKIDYDALDFEGFHSGIGLFYYRSESEVVKMLNHLRGIRSMSIWSENFYIAYKMSQDIRSCKYITINSGIEAASDVYSFGWQYELVYCTEISNGLETFSDGINPSWSRLSTVNRWQTVNSMLDSLQLLNTDTIKFALQRTIKVIEEDTLANKMSIVNYQPIGKIAVQLNELDTFDGTALLLFGLNALLFGNSLLLIGKENNAQLAIWKQIENYLIDKNFDKLVSTIGYFPSVPVTFYGVTQIIDKNYKSSYNYYVKGLFIDQNHFQEKYYGRLLRRISSTVVVTLTEYEMAKLIE
ncbi:hypothetical protein BLOT_014005 [Blomia tropicalis]|nr:hypothetical protein BLOT_014005 [Blomia tropicalis]